MAAEYGRNINNIVPGVNRGVRFAGVATQKGIVIEGGFQNEIEPHLDQDKEQQLYLDSLSAVRPSRDFSESLGMWHTTLRSIGELLLTFPLKQGRILCISVCPGTGLINIKNQLMKIITSKTCHIYEKAWHLQAELWSFHEERFLRVDDGIIPATRMMTSTIVPLLFWRFCCQKR